MSPPVTRRLRRPAWALVATVVVACAAVLPFVGPAGATGSRPVAPTVRAANGPSVTGGGASFPALEIGQWTADVAKPPYRLGVNYTAAGSTFGRNQFLLGNFDFGVSDIRFQDYDQAAINASSRKNFVYVPVVAGALGFMFNVVGTDGQPVTDLKLTQQDVCRIFTEPDMSWNDPAIAATNPGIPLPAAKIRPVVRSDGSGTSSVFSEFCIATSPDVWGGFIARVNGNGAIEADTEFRQGRPTEKWPQVPWVSAAFASDGIANFVADPVTGANTITYVESGYSTKVGKPTAQIRNSSGQFVPPLPQNATVALGYAEGRPDGTFRLNYQGPDPRAYFPSTYSYVIAETGSFDPAKGSVLAQFLNYAVTAGQNRAEPLLYARLSSVLVNLALDQIQKIPGAPPRPTDLAGAPPPVEVVGGSPTAGGVAGGPGGAGAAGPGAAAGKGGAAGAAGAGAGAVGPGAAAGKGGAAGAGAAGAAGAAGGAAAAGATDSAGGAAAGENGYSLDVNSAKFKDIAKKQGGGSTQSQTTGPELGRVLTALLVGFVLMGIGSFAAQGVRTGAGRT